MILSEIPIRVSWVCGQTSCSGSIFSPPRPTSNWDGMGFFVGRGRIVVHFLRSMELTSTTRLSFDHLQHRSDEIHYADQAILFKLSWNGFRGKNYSRMPGFGSAVLLVLVCLTNLAVSPTLPTHKLHLQIWGSKPLQWCGELLEWHKINGLCQVMWKICSQMNIRNTFRK